MPQNACNLTTAPSGDVRSALPASARSAERSLPSDRCLLAGAGQPAWQRSKPSLCELNVHRRAELESGLAPQCSPRQAEAAVNAALREPLGRPGGAGAGGLRCQGTRSPLPPAGAALRWARRGGGPAGLPGRRGWFRGGGGGRAVVAAGGQVRAGGCRHREAAQHSAARPSPAGQGRGCALRRVLHGRVARVGAAEGGG